MKYKETQDVIQLRRKIEAQYNDLRTNNSPGWYDVLMLCKYLKLVLEDT